MKIIAHRGGAGLRVENTLAAFDHAIDVGADGAELDVHLSADGHVVVHHDDCLNSAYCRYTDGTWLDPGKRIPLAGLSYAQLQQYDIGTPRPDSAYARRFERIQAVPQQRIPLLRDVIRQVKQRQTDFFLLIEIKAALLELQATRLQTLVDATLSLLQAEQFTQRAILCSFDWRSMLYAKQQCAGIRTWLISSPLSWFHADTPPAADIPPPPEQLNAIRRVYADGDAPWFAGHDPRHYGGSYPRAAAAAGADAWYPYHRDCTTHNCQQAHQLGLETAAWSVNLNDQAALRRVAQTGVGHLAVDYPDTRPEASIRRE